MTKPFKTYFDTMGEAVDYAIEYYKDKFTLTEDISFKFRALYYEQTQTQLLEGVNNKNKHSLLNITLYRFKTGTYELVAYPSN